MPTILVKENTDYRLDELKTLCNRGRTGNKISKGDIIAALLPDMNDKEKTIELLLKKIDVEKYTGQKSKYDDTAIWLKRQVERDEVDT